MELGLWSPQYLGTHRKCVYVCVFLFLCNHLCTSASVPKQAQRSKAAWSETAMKTSKAMCQASGMAYTSPSQRVWACGTSPSQRVWACGRRAFTGHSHHFVVGIRGHSRAFAGIRGCFCPWPPLCERFLYCQGTHFCDWPCSQISGNVIRAVSYYNTKSAGRHPPRPAESPDRKASKHPFRILGGARSVLGGARSVSIILGGCLAADG